MKRVIVIGCPGGGKSLLSTDNCKISDFLEENLKRGFEIKFFPRSPIQFILNFTDKSISQRRKVSALGNVLSGKIIIAIY